MKIVFDQNTLEDWKNRDISAVFVWLKRAGCAGTEIEVIEAFDSEGLVDFPQESGIIVFMKLEEVEKIDNSILTKIKGKWICTNEKILSRCWCGSSFSFEKKEKIASIHKIAEMKEKFKKQDRGMSFWAKRENPL